MKKIRLHKEFGNVIVTRNAVVRLFHSLASLSSEIVLDFKNVEFISRSAAHEYMRQKISLNKRVEEVNMNENVKAMFILVAKQLKKTMT